MSESEALSEIQPSVHETAARLNLAELPKDSLVQLCRRVFGVVGDTARTAKATYLARLQNTERSQVNEAIVAMVLDGELEYDDGQSSPAPAPAPAPAADTELRRPVRRTEPVTDDGQAARQLREALQALGIGRSDEPQPIDEEAVRTIVDEAMTVHAARLTDELLTRLDERLQSFKGPERVIALTPDGRRREVQGHTHDRFDRVLKLASIRQNVLIVGPAGCGKTRLAAQVAEALGLSFAFVSCSAGMSESALQGWLLPVQAGGAFCYVPAAFVTAYEHGGVFLLDELDAADENLLLVINSALANGQMSIPQRHGQPIVQRHADFVCIAAANTYGHGADRVYAGRNQLDAATLDRFRAGIVTMDYDEALEGQLCDPDVLEWGHAIRRQITAHRLRRVMSTRALLDFTRQKDLLGFERADWEESYLADWSRDERVKVGA